MSSLNFLIFTRAKSSHEPLTCLHTQLFTRSVVTGKPRSLVNGQIGMACRVKQDDRHNNAASLREEEIRKNDLTFNLVANILGSAFLNNTS